jgi:hypothetical protein
MVPRSQAEDEGRLAANLVRQSNAELAATVPQGTTENESAFRTEAGK